MNPFFTKAEKEQLMMYAKWAEESGCYCGRKDYWEKRHELIILKLKNL